MNDQILSPFDQEYVLQPISQASIPKKYHPKITNYKELKTIIEDSQSQMYISHNDSHHFNKNNNKKAQNIQNSNNNNIHNVHNKKGLNKLQLELQDQYRFQESSSHTLDNYKLLELRDVTPKDIYEDSSEDEQKKKNYFSGDLPSPILPASEFTNNRFQMPIFNKTKINDLEFYRNKSNNSNNNNNIYNYPTNHINVNNNTNHETNYQRGNLSSTLNDMEQILQIGSNLNENTKLQGKTNKEKELLIQKHTQNPTKSKPKDPVKMQKNQEAQKKYEEMTYELYYKNTNDNGNNNKNQENPHNFNKTTENLSYKLNTSVSQLMKPQDLQEFSNNQELSHRSVPQMDQFEFLRAKNQIKPQKTSSNLHEILAYDRVFQLNNNENSTNNRIFPLQKPISTVSSGSETAVLCLDCNKLIAFSLLEQHLEACPCEEKLDKLLPKLNEQELEKWASAYEKNLTLFNEISNKYEKNMGLLMKNPYFADMFRQFKTIHINNGLNIVTTALKRIVSSYKELEKSGYLQETYGLSPCIKSLIVLAREKPLILKYNLDVKDPMLYKHALYKELKELEKQTEVVAKELLDEIAITSAKGKPQEIMNLSSYDSDYSAEEDYLYNNSNNLNNNSLEQNIYLQNEQEKREFYSEAVRIKLSLPPKHKGRELVISELYEECQRRRLAKKDWESQIPKKMQPSPSRFYIINHMDEFLYEWSLCEYIQMHKYMTLSANQAKISLVLSNAASFLSYKGDAKSCALNEKNIECFKNSHTSFYFLSQDINKYVTPLQTLSFSLETQQNTYMAPQTVDFQRVCLLDMRAEAPLVPEDSSLFDVVIFGGILGDHPPRDRTSALRKQGYSIRNLGSLQMSTDTAMLVTSLVLEKGRKLEEIPYVDEPEIQGKEKKGVKESVQIEGFRYVDSGIDLLEGKDKEKTGVPLMSEKIREELIFKELDLNDFL